MPVDDARERLSTLQLEKRSEGIAIAAQSKSHIRSVFGELLATSPSKLMLADDKEQEATVWECFAEVFEKEVEAQLGEGKALSNEEKRQILADIMVWAEITQPHYDAGTASFVTEPHGKDGSFQRVGRWFKDAKAQRGLA